MLPAGAVTASGLNSTRVGSPLVKVTVTFAFGGFTLEVSARSGCAKVSFGIIRFDVEKVGAVTLMVALESPGTEANPAGCDTVMSVWPTPTGVKVALDC